MVYNWDGKEAECYRLYVEEKKSMDEVMEFWEQRGFTPSKRAFQTQFKRWDFPSKQNPAHKNPLFIARVKELWEKNYMQKDMLDALQDEGFQINDRELMRVRLKFKWFLRDNSNRGKNKRSADGSVQKSKPKKRKVASGKGLVDQMANAILQESSRSEEDESEDAEDEEHVQAQDQVIATPAQADPEPESIHPAEALRRQLRQEQMRIESDEKWRTRRRRRRTRGWAGLPADAPGEPPRFPSETTLDEGKAALGLDNKLYKELREQFQAICEEQGVKKKTIAGPEKWAQLLQTLIHKNAHLSNVFQPELDVLQHNDAFWRPKNHKALSLDVMCQDVTKRLRVMDKQMTLPEAKNTLNLNPEQTRKVRTAFLAILKEDQFTNKFEAGDQRWAELKQKWVRQSEQLSRVLAIGAADAEHQEKLKALEVLARDVMKRFRAEATFKDPTKKKQVHQGPGPGPAPPSVVPHASQSHLRSRNRTTSHNTAIQASNDSGMLATSASQDFEIDPSLLLAASDASIIPPQSFQHNAQGPPHHQHPPPLGSMQHNYSSNLNPGISGLQSSSQLSSSFLPSGVPLPIYFRLHPHSSTPFPNKTVWLSVLQSGTVAEVRNLAMREHPGTEVVGLEGLVVHRGGGVDREVRIAVDDDAELTAFLGHVGSGKATFVVLLGMGSSGGGYV